MHARKYQGRQHAIFQVGHLRIQSLDFLVCLWRIEEGSHRICLSVCLSMHNTHARVGLKGQNGAWWGDYRCLGRKRAGAWHTLGTISGGRGHVFEDESFCWQRVLFLPITQATLYN